MPDYNLITLPNGLRLLVVPMLTDSVTVMVGVNAGSRYETRQNNGLFHFLEHMAFKGTKKRPTTLDISSAIDGVGGVFNAFTDKEITAYHIKLTTKHLPLAFDILGDMLTNSIFEIAEIEREKGVILQEINMREDMPMTKVQVGFERLLYGDNPMGWDIAGEKETVAGIKRDDFLQILGDLYYPQNMLVVVAGGVKVNQVNQIRKLIEENFHLLQKKNQKITKLIKLSQSKSQLKLFNKTTEQAHFCLGVPGYRLTHPDRYALIALTTILGGGMSSRLFLEIRERRGLAYYVGSEISQATDCGYFVCRAGVKLEKIEEAIKVTLNEMQKISSKPVENKELIRAKEMLKGHLILAMEDSHNVAERYLNQLLLEGKIRTVLETLKEIDKVSVDDVLRVAKDLFQPQKLNLALIGPYKSEDKFAKILK